MNFEPTWAHCPCCLFVGMEFRQGSVIPTTSKDGGAAERSTGPQFQSVNEQQPLPLNKPKLSPGNVLLLLKQKLESCADMGRAAP